MAIHIQDIIEALTRDVHEAYKRIKENDLKVSIPEIEIELNLEVDLDGLEEKMPESTMIRKGVKVLDVEDVRDVPPIPRQMLRSRSRDELIRNPYLEETVGFTEEQAKKEAERLKKFGFEGADTLIEEVRLKIKKSGSRIKETLSEDAINWAKDGNTNKAEERITQLKDLGFEKEADTLSEKVSLLLELHEKKTKN